MSAPNEMSGRYVTKQDREVLRVMEKFVAALYQEHITPQQIVRVAASVDRAAKEIARKG